MHTRAGWISTPVRGCPSVRRELVICGAVHALPPAPTLSPAQPSSTLLNLSSRPRASQSHCVSLRVDRRRNITLAVFLSLALLLMFPHLRIPVPWGTAACRRMVLPESQEPPIGHDTPGVLVKCKKSTDNTSQLLRTDRNMQGDEAHRCLRLGCDSSSW